MDLGGTEPIRMVGGSLGGISTLLTGSMEPAIDAITPISGGAGLLDIGVRSLQSGIPEAFLLRAMCPLYIGTTDTQGEMLLETLIPDLNDKAELPFASASGVKPLDTVVVENLANKELGCGMVSREGKVRVSVQSDEGDPTRLLFYSGYVVTRPDCKLRAGAKPYLTVRSGARQM